MKQIVTLMASAVIFSTTLVAHADTSTGYSPDFAIENRTYIPGDAATSYSDLFTIDNHTLGGGDSSTGFSGIFSICNTCGDTRARPPAAIARSPYTDNPHQLRGQFHAHSVPDKLWAGPVLNDNDFANKYRNLGYDFLALTNHWPDAIVTRPISPVSLNPVWDGWVPCSVELTYGTNGVRDGHLISIDMKQGTTTTDIEYPRTGESPRDVAYNMTTRIQRVHNQGGMAFIAHPDANGIMLRYFPTGHDYSITTDELVQICRNSKPEGISIYQVMSPNAEAKWDRVLQTCGFPVWGCSEDDWHPDAYYAPLLGSTWIGVPGNPGTPWSSIRSEVTKGNFYAYWVSKGSRWTESYDPPTMHVTVDNSGTYPVISAQINDLNGHNATFHFKTKEGYFGGSTYTCNGNEHYVRVQADVDLGWGRTLYIRSQPIWIDPIDQTGAASSSGFGNPDLALRWRYGDRHLCAPVSVHG
ncbi:MAG: hypothetical protein HYX78_11010, partial [Armatimonadetes bacterium]|nr:hypothetical protein [Armatimonadota bacterium]